MKIDSLAELPFGRWLNDLILSMISSRSAFEKFAPARLFFSGVMACFLTSPSSALSQSCSTEKDVDKTLKCHGIELIKLLKIALEEHAVTDPEKLKALTGIEVLDWTRETEKIQFRDAQTWKFNNPVLDATERVFGNRRFTGLTYRVGTSIDGAVRSGLVLHGFPDLGCISVSELSEIFRPFEIKAQLRPLPFHGPRNPPFWNVSASVFPTRQPGRMTFSFLYIDEYKPTPTCLERLGISDYK